MLWQGFHSQVDYGGGTRTCALEVGGDGGSHAEAVLCLEGRSCCVASLKILAGYGQKNMLRLRVRGKAPIATRSRIVR